MKIFALQTNVDVLRKQYTVQGEEELLITHFHWISFFFHTYKQILLWLIAIVGYLTLENYGVLSFPYTTIALVGWSISLGIVLMNGYIRYRYNFIMVTSEKVVLIEQKSLFYHHVNPMHLATIVSTDVESQFFGIVHCGRIVLNLTQRTEYSSKQLKANCVPQPNAVAGIIENAIVLDKKRNSIQEDITHQKAEVHALQEQAKTVSVDKPIKPKATQRETGNDHS